MELVSSKVGFILCSRADSSRVKSKPFQPVNGIPLIDHLISRLAKTSIHIYLAVPHRDVHLYKYLTDKFKGVMTLTAGSAEDPLQRMHAVAERFGLDTVIRVCHDKIFVDPEMVRMALDRYVSERLDYVYSSRFVDGSSFEIISIDSLTKAVAKFKNVEHISYAIHCVSEKKLDVDFSSVWRSGHRLLVDYPDDLKVLEVILSTLGNNCSLSDALRFLDQNPKIAGINALPKLTIYTCAYNAEKYITKCMGSVAKQKGFKNFEYVIVDDFSTDRTPYLVSMFCSIYKNVRWVRNPKNVGLASSSNIALTGARSKYIIRLDADDYFPSDSALEAMLSSIETTDYDVMYPNNYYGKMTEIQNGNECHHVGGAIFRTRAVNHIKFTDGLRGYEGLDFFVRANEQLKIGYINSPMFFYRRHPGSMSVTNLEEREQIKKAILA